MALLSSGKSIQIINEWKKKELQFTCGVSINQISLNENDIGEFKTFLKLSPPLRKEQDRLDLIDGIKNELIDIIVSACKTHLAHIMPIMPFMPIN